MFVDVFLRGSDTDKSIPGNASLKGTSQREGYPRTKTYFVCGGASLYNAAEPGSAPSEGLMQRSSFVASMRKRWALIVPRYRSLFWTESTPSIRASAIAAIMVSQEQGIELFSMGCVTGFPRCGAEVEAGAVVGHHDI